MTFLNQLQNLFGRRSPSQPTDLYRVYDHTQRLLYVGISYDSGARLQQHLRTQPWADQVHQVIVKRYPSRPAARAAERRAIRREGPIFNRQG
jgi:predicted GIY-YIG superfamily endonuclease